MKQSEFTACAACGHGMAKNNIFFYRVRIEQMILNTAAIKRQAGLEMMIGSPALATVFSPNEDLAVGLGEKMLLLCGECGTGGSSLPVACLLELLGEDGGE